MIEKFKSKESRRIWWILGSLLAINVVIILITLLVYMFGPTKGSAGDAANYLLNQVYLNNFFKQPALVLGFITLFGYLIMGRGAKDSFLGALKCVIGYVLLAIGSGTLTGVAKPVFQAISEIGGAGVNVVPLDPYFALNAGNNFFQNFRVGADFVGLITYVFIVGFVVNIILVSLKKWTNVNSLMITGHVMLQQAAVITPAFYVLMFSQIPLLNNMNISSGAQAGVAIVAGLFLGAYWGIASTGTLKATNKVTGDAGFAIGHQQMLTIALAYKMSRFFGSPEDSAETKKMPKALKIFEDNVFVQTAIISILFLILFIILISTGTIDAGLGASIKDGHGIAGQWNTTFGGAHWVINIFGGAIKLVAALICMMTGVRMFVTELQQSFTGISEKLVKDAVIAVDIAAVYGFCPNSVTFAFASGTIAQFLGTFVTIGLSMIPGSQIAVVIPLFVTLFFNSGAIGPYANAAGGYKAVLTVPAIIGFIEIIVISLGLWAVQNASGNIGSVTAYELVKDANVTDAIKQTQGFVGIQDSIILFESSVNIKDIAGIDAVIATNDAGEFIVSKTWNSNPFAEGYIGMGDWTLFFGSIMLISGWHIVIASIVVPIAFLGLFSYGWILDSDKQHKKTWLQKLLKLNPVLKEQSSQNE